LSSIKPVVDAAAAAFSVSATGLKTGVAARISLLPVDWPSGGSGFPDLKSEALRPISMASPQQR
jgi:hypothetical protein